MSLSTQQRWLIGCGGVIAFFVLIVVLLMVSVTVHVGRWVNGLEEGFIKNSTETVARIYGEEIPDHYTANGFTLPGFGSFSFLTDSAAQQVFLAIEMMNSAADLKTLASDEREAVEAKIEEFMNHSNQASQTNQPPQEYHFVDRRFIKTSAGPQMLLLMYSTQVRPTRLSDAGTMVMPFVVAPLQYPKNRAIFLLYFNETLLFEDEGNGEEDRKADPQKLDAAFQAMSRDVNQLIQQTALKKELIPSATGNVSG